ncbi:hypothetical protein C6P45_004084 [Maudiozyma exigua]|uniref:Uncharacterized protein n=1 Tax=Maudiozyma exigua TaxID=34358 RepID=A0A9P6WED9_MAUEX|nr:hypothetical protein C6P45_004084 [Kazachstania exigua]
MEITRVYRIKKNQHIGYTRDTLVFDVNNSKINLEIEQCINSVTLNSDTKNQHITEIVNAQILVLLKDVLKILGKERNITINICLFKKDTIKLWFWNEQLSSIIHTTYPHLYFECSFIVTLQSNIDRQYYQDNSSMLNTFQKIITENEDATLTKNNEEEKEHLIKLILLEICNENQLKDEDIELVVTNYSSLNEIIRDC